MAKKLSYRSSWFFPKAYLLRSYKKISLNLLRMGFFQNCSYFHLYKLCVGMLAFTGRPDQTKNDSDLKFGTHTPPRPYLKSCFMFFWKTADHVDFSHISSITFSIYFYVFFTNHINMVIIKSVWNTNPVILVQLYFRLIFCF